MGRKGGSPLERSEAQAIAKKLKAKVETGGAHNVAYVYWNEFLITHFGIRHGHKSKHGHIPTALFINQNQALKLAVCTMSRDEYFEVLQAKKKLPAIDA